MGTYYLVVPKGGGMYFTAQLSLLKVVVAAGAIHTDDGGILYINFYDDGTYELVCGNRYDRGTYTVENGEIKLLSRSKVEMTVAEDGTLVYVFSNGAEIKITLDEDILTKIKAA